MRLLTLAGATDVPVAQGAAEPLSSELALANYVRGDSGLDGPELPEPAFKAVAEPAAEFNTYCDPEALDLVLHSDVPVRMVAGGLRRSGTPRRWTRGTTVVDIHNRYPDLPANAKVAMRLDAPRCWDLVLDSVDRLGKGL